MNAINKSQSLITCLALLLAVPAAYFCCITLLKYSLHIDAPYEASATTMRRFGFGESAGFNINGAILIGPLLAMGLTMMQVVRMDVGLNGDHIRFYLRVRKHWFPLVVAALSVVLIALLFLYIAR